MKIIVVGAGDVGSYMCQVLSEAGNEVTLIESIDSVADDIEERLDVRVIRGNGASAKYIKRAGAASCDFFMALTAHDQLNIVSCSLAHNLGAKFTIARVHDEVYSDTSVVNYQDYFNIDLMLNPEALTAVDLAKSIRSPDRVAIEDFARGKIELQQIEISDGAKIVGKSLREAGLPSDLRIGYVRRAGELFVAGPDTVLQPSDKVTVIGAPEKIFARRDMFSSADDGGSVRIVIYGATETAVALMRMLSNRRFKVRVIEQNLSRCREIAEAFPNVTVVNGSATSLRLLEEEQVESADFFVACSRDDEENIMTGLQVKKLGVKNVKLVINKPDYEQVLRSISSFLDIQVALSPRKATATEVQKHITDKKYALVGSIDGGDIVCVEIKVPSLSSAVGKTIRQLGLPRGCIAAVLMKTDGAAKVPEADDKLSGADRIILILNRSDIQKLVDIICS